VDEFRKDKAGPNKVDEELILDAPVVDRTVYCPASIVDVAELLSEHDSVQPAPEPVRAGPDIVSDKVVKLAITLNDIPVDWIVSIAEADESVSEHDSVLATPVVCARLDEVEVSHRSPLGEENSTLTEGVEEIEEIDDAVKPDWATSAEVTFGNI
jgi:hypothetical protein